MKKLKCHCNDDTACPLKEITGQIELNDRYCSTSTVCVTKHLKRTNGSTWYKYFCDQSPPNSIRGNVVKYRDCMINSTNTFDQKIASKEHEYCCNTKDFCNRDLKPYNTIQDIDELITGMSSSNSNKNNLNISNIKTNPILLSSVNVVLLSLLFTFLLITVVLVILYFIKNNKRFVKLKVDLNIFNKEYYQQNCSQSSSSKKTDLTATTILTSKQSASNCYEWSGSEPAQQMLLTSKVNENEENEKFLPINYSLPNTNTNTITSSNSSCVMTYLSSTSTTDERCDINNHLNKLNYPQNYAKTMPLQQPIDNINSTTSDRIINGAEYNEWSGSGSGAGVAQLLQRTIARQIKLLYPCIGKGRFGEVYKGMWRDEYVAVKTFNSADEKSWQNECNIYNTSGFRHENILGFIAADNIDRGTYTELWIITEFHSNGSLFDFLNLNTISIYELLKMSISIVNGLDHLHTPIESCTGKPALAHCDLKSKNILVKSDLTCCIGDLGLALCGDKMGNVLIKSNQSSCSPTPIYLQELPDENKTIIRTGTKRYMAPEIISKTIDTKSLVEFQNAEMYSLALIFWELLRRTKFEIDKKLYIYDYKLPYYEFIQMDPDDLQMKTIVCDQKKRPEINLLWKQINIMNEIAQLTQELWLENSHARLNALRLKKSLNSIMRKYF